MENENRDRWCFTWIPQDQASPGIDRAALLKRAQWARGTIITVSFLDGDPAVQQKVARYAEEWTEGGLANLRFDFRKGTADTMIRISFQYGGSWSVLGKTCSRIRSMTQPTMNFGWLKPTSWDVDIKPVVLHEFGHALGLIHEHQNPKNGIHWNRNAVIRDLSGPPNYWPPQVIEANVFHQYNQAQVLGTPVDKDSIMMYPIPNTWTTDGFSVGLNDQISANDRTLIRKAYA